MRDRFRLLYNMSLLILNSFQLSLVFFTWVLCLFIGLALQNNKRGMNDNLDTDISSTTIDPIFVDFGHLIIEASIIPT